MRYKLTVTFPGNQVSVDYLVSQLNTLQAAFTTGARLSMEQVNLNLALSAIVVEGNVNPDRVEEWLEYLSAYRKDVRPGTMIFEVVI